MKYDYKPKPGDLFVALGIEYKDVKVLRAVVDRDDDRNVFGTYWDAEFPGFVKKPIEEYPGPLFPFFSEIGKPKEEIRSEFELYLRVRKVVEDFLSDKRNYSAKIGEVERCITHDHGIDEIDAKAILKVLIADTVLFEFKSLQAGEYLSFSTLKTRSENRIRYFGSLGAEIRIKSDKISLLVSHGQTVGNYRELILRDLLKKYLPAKFSVVTGFIEGFSRQLDIIIYDSHNFSPSFLEGELAVVQQEAVRAVIEVKTTLDATTLFESLEMFHEIAAPGFRTSNLPIYKAVFAFDTGYVETSTIADVVDRFYNEPFYHEGLKTVITRDISYLFHEVSCVCVMKKHCLVAQYAADRKGANILPMLWSFRDTKGYDIQTAIFLSQLFGYLDVENFGKKSSIWNYRMLVNSSWIVKKERNLAKDDWSPRFLGGHNGDQKSIRERLHLFNKWFEGDVDTAEFIKSFEPKANRARAAEDGPQGWSENPQLSLLAVGVSTAP